MAAPDMDRLETGLAQAELDRIAFELVARPDRDAVTVGHAGRLPPAAEDQRVTGIERLGDDVAGSPAAETEGPAGRRDGGHRSVAAEPLPGGLASDPQAVGNLGPRVVAPAVVGSPGRRD